MIRTCIDNGIFHPAYIPFFKLKRFDSSIKCTMTMLQFLYIAQLMHTFTFIVIKNATC